MAGPFGPGLKLEKDPRLWPQLIWESIEEEPDEASVIILILNELIEVDCLVLRCSAVVLVLHAETTINTPHLEGEKTGLRTVNLKSCQWPAKAY